MKIHNGLGEVEVVGIYEVTETEEWRRIYETASWYVVVEVTPGYYPIVRQKRSVWVEAGGKVTASYFGANGRMNDEVGQTQRISRGIATYGELPEAVNLFEGITL